MRLALTSFVAGFLTVLAAVMTFSVVLAALPVDCEQVRAEVLVSRLALPHELSCLPDSWVD